MKRLFFVILFFVSSLVSSEDYSKLYPVLYTGDISKVDEVLKKLQSPTAGTKALDEIFKPSDSALQKIANGILKGVSNKILDEFNKISFEDVKNFISKQATSLKQEFIRRVLKADVDAFRKNDEVKRYTIAKPKDLSPGSSSHEAEFLNRSTIPDGFPSALGRLYRTRATLERITGITPKDPKQIPRIGIAFSGGGYRALTLTAGYMKAFEELGILDASLYISTLSGSTWYLGPWIFLQDSQKTKTPQPLVTASQYYDLIIKKIEDDTFNPFSYTNIKTFSRQRFANDIIFPNMIFGQPIGGVPQVFGAILAHAEFGSAPFEEYKDRQQQMRLSGQWPKIMNGEVPWPIYTSVSMHRTNGDYRYNWYEFNPEEVRNLENGLYIPSFAFGRQFEAGKSKGMEFEGKTYFPPEQSFGFLMGIFGSAYTINAIDLYRIYFLPAPSPEDVKAFQEEEDAIQQTPSLVQAIKNRDVKALATIAVKYFNPIAFAVAMVQVAQTLLEYARDTFIEVGKMRAAPAQVFNPFYKYQDFEISSWLKDRSTITFIDGGIHYNVPLRPLVLPERELDIIFVGDASGNVTQDIAGEVPTEMKKAFADIDRIDDIIYTYDAKLSDMTMHTYRPDAGHPKAPVIVYFNFLLDPEVLKTKISALQKVIDENKLREFNLEKCLGEYCSTFNFAQNKDQFKQLSSVAYLNVMAHKDKILTNEDSIIKERFKKEEDWLEFGDTSEINVEQKQNVPDIVVPASDVRVPAMELIIPAKQTISQLYDQLSTLQQQLNALLQKLSVRS